jgi:very-short-patch-repair endonuclease
MLAPGTQRNIQSTMPSPIEKQFLAAWQRHYPNVPLATEYPVYNGRYRIDFAHPLTRIVVELDGYEHHNDRDKFTSDRQRDRALQRDG